jgi:hypothetical protein
MGLRHKRNIHWSRIATDLRIHTMIINEPEPDVIRKIRNNEHVFCLRCCQGTQVKSVPLVNLLETARTSFLLCQWSLAVSRLGIMSNGYSRTIANPLPFQGHCVGVYLSTCSCELRTWTILLLPRLQNLTLQ